MLIYAWLMLGVLVSLLLCAGAFHLLARMGEFGKRVLATVAKAPSLDVVVFVLTMGPMIAAGVTWGVWFSGPLHFFGLIAAAVVAQCLSLIIWSKLHVWAHPEVKNGPRIVKSLNRAVGPIRNNVALWWTAIAVPMFNLIRITEYVAYPVLVRIIRLPEYKNGDWVNVSRQKFTGLVGYDLIWCLYCDWMTGVWSLGSEMLRNIESFWCPIRFSSPEKCENCRMDFPDVDNAWVREDTDITAAAALIDAKYPGPNGINAWLGHPVRLTHERKSID
ncbi:MAG: hypothetical protein H7210_11045 [Pyrinomonadaceae bacterium]|nr:hypothetical protein [Phycisphaerales bacterium]